MCVLLGREDDNFSWFTGHTLSIQDANARRHNVTKSSNVTKYARKMPENLSVIWYGLPIHRAHEVKAFLRAGGTKHIHLERLPNYAPDLNPDEGIWRYLKRVEMKNLCCHKLNELRHELSMATTRLRHKTHIILSCFLEASLSFQV